MTSKNMEKYNHKNRNIKHSLLTNFEELVEKRMFGEYERTYYILGDKEPLISFSSLVAPINTLRFGKIPPKNLFKAQEIGKNVMINLQSYFLTNEIMINESNLEQLNNIVLEFLGARALTIKSVEKYFISECKKYHCFLDLVVWDNQSKEYAIVEIKTKSFKNKEIDRLAKLQGAFYKKMFYNAKTYILVINRDYDNSKEYNEDTNWKYVDYVLSPKENSNALTLIEAFYNYENWDNYYVARRK